MLHIISYDIRDDHRRDYISKILEGYGLRVQFSVFECHLTPEKLDELWQKLSESINPSDDSLRCYPLCGACVNGIKFLGKPPVSPESGFYVS